MEKAGSAGHNCQAPTWRKPRLDFSWFADACLREGYPYIAVIFFPFRQQAADTSSSPVPETNTLPGHHVSYRTVARSSSANHLSVGHRSSAYVSAAWALSDLKKFVCHGQLHPVPPPVAVAPQAQPLLQSPLSAVRVSQNPLPAAPKRCTTHNVAFPWLRLPWRKYLQEDRIHQA